MRKTCVIGLGNRLLTDDGIGVYLVEALQARDPAGRFDYFCGETDVEHCIARIGDAEQVIIIDAAFLGKRPGEITVIPWPRLAIPGYDGFGHENHLWRVIGQAKPGLYKKEGSGFFIGIEPAVIDFNFGLSPVLNSRFAKILTGVRAILLSAG
ncbi:MAG: hydrogenase maturation protease [Heliobacteriaceae bacterium]|nr:hydrogenase maturation protease [Heliobacteriaceae bacterium]